MANRSRFPAHTRFLISFSLVLALGLSGFWLYYQQKGLPGIQFPFLPALSEPSWTDLAVLEGSQMDNSSLYPSDTERPVLVLVWLNTDHPVAWEQWKHLASIADHPRMDLTRLVVMADKNLEEMEQHALSMLLPPNVEYKFMHVSPTQVEQVFSASATKTNSYTWVYLHKDPIFAEGGRLVPPREWLNKLQW